MCGRFSLDPDNEEIASLVRQLPYGSPAVKTGEIFPTNVALTLALREGKKAPEAMAWGFPRWDGKGVIINARADSALKKPMFAKALRERPAVIPTTGFYEWRANPGAKNKDKFIFRQPDSPLLYLAGFWSEFPDQEVPQRFTILTTDANPAMRAYHSRMPVLLKASDIDAWLLGANREEILAREPFTLEGDQIYNKP